MIHDRLGTADEVTPHLRIQVRWLGEHRFDAGPAGRSRGIIDGDSKDGASPPETLLAALATCTAVDVIDILAKRRTPVASLEIDVTAERADAVPRRFVKVHLAYAITGAGIERVHAERAIELGVTKYCTVRDTLDPNMPVLWSLDLSEG